ncbi:MAG: DNA-formamidopyrimidine glycosylase family protein [Opitutales bacterium]
MPELGEVLFFAKRWDAGVRERIQHVALHPEKRIFRECDTTELQRALTDSKLRERLVHGKQMAFRADNGWLGIHLGMTGKLRCEPRKYEPAKHDHMVLYTARRALVFEDFRLFGRVRFHPGQEPPEWWAKQPPMPTDAAFTRERFSDILQRRGKAPIKAVLLLQAYFPGIGNWMADEVLWRARIRPDRLAGELSRRKEGELYAKVREVCADAMRLMGGEGLDELPGNHNDLVPESWLFRHRWREGGTCPETGVQLRREKIGGRTTCWSPKWQR